MAELTAEVVRTIVKEIVNGEVGSLRTEIKDGFKRVDIELERHRIETASGFKRVNSELETYRTETASGFERVLDTVQALTDEDRDELAGVKGRLHNHNERIAALERLSHLR